jgi:catechol 2,3-dioxygenase-like lactoylglutathione lyase family enzyme
LLRNQEKRGDMVRHLGSIAEIVNDLESAILFYQNVLGLEVKREENVEYAVVKVPGALHFGLWSRASAAEHVYGDSGLSHQIPLGFTVGFEVDDVDAGAKAAAAAGWRIEQAAKDEPWGQRAARFFSPSGALCEIASTPNSRTLTSDIVAKGES